MSYANNWLRLRFGADATNHALFESRVAGNALGILNRQLAMGKAFESEQNARLNALGQSHETLCAGLYDGTVALTNAGVWDHLRRSALERMSIDQPKYAGLQKALSRWCD